MEDIEDKNIVQIPRKLKRKVTSHSNNYYHYELIKIYPHHVVYKCIETGTRESFCKNEFVVRGENQQIEI